MLALETSRGAPEPKQIRSFAAALRISTNLDNGDPFTIPNLQIFKEGLSSILPRCVRVDNLKSKLR